jgi:hypothetical protein
MAYCRQPVRQVPEWRPEPTGEPWERELQAVRRLLGLLPERYGAALWGQTDPAPPRKDTPGM